jgi:hypothetical protein
MNPVTCFGGWKASFLAGMICFWVAGFTSAATSDDPMDRLQHVESFAVGGIGIAGTTSDGERALRALLQGQNATEQLQSLFAHATPAGQLYALLGLRVHDRATYEKALQAFKAPEIEVETIAGCIISRAPFKQLLDRIKAGQYDPILERPAR